MPATKLSNGSNGKSLTVDSADAKAFEKAADAYRRKEGASKATALAALHRIGIVTKTGRLAKHYR